jgi:hypothetical protein
LKKKAVAATAAALGMALLFYAQGARAANLASDNGSLYQNPWGPDNPQNQTTTGFGPRVFDRWNTPTTPFFIDTTRGAWGINVPAHNNGSAGYDAALRGFTGDQTFLSPGQTFSTTVLYTPPGAYSPTEQPVEGVDFFAQAPGVPPSYDGFGHQVLGIYFAANTPSGPAFGLAVWTALSDEHAQVFKQIPLPFTGTASSPQAVNILVWENTSTGQRGIWLLKNGVFSSSLDLPTVPVQWHIVGVGDFKGDGNADLVWENTSTGQRAIWLLKNGVFSSSLDLPTVPVQWHIAGAGNFSGDGYAGLVWQNTDTGQRAIWFMKNGVLTSSINSPMVPLTWSIEDH